jgi:hypothetical protein
VVVAVLAVLMMEMRADNVVRMRSVRDCLMAAIATVLVLLRVFRAAM